MRKLLTLVVVIVVLVAADLVVKGVAERRVATELQSSFGGAGETTIEFGGFPFVVRLASGSIPVATVMSSSLVRDGIRLTDIRMTLQDLEFSLSEVMSGDVGSISIRDGHGRAAMKPGALTKVFAALDGSVELELSSGRLEAKIGPVSGRAQLSISGTDLVLGIPGVDRTVTVGLPRFISGMQYQAVRLDGAQAIIEFSLQGAQFSRS